MRVYSNHGIIIEDNGLKLGLDNGKGDINFISHAHSDHLFSSKKSVLSSSETLLLARARNKHVGELFSDDNFELLNAGHVLGSCSLLYHGSKSVLFTGDFCTRDRHFLKGFKPKSADVLIMETTFGRPEYVFPSFNNTVKKIKNRIGELVSGGKNVLLSGYGLGKAQHLCKIVDGFSNVFVDVSVKKINDVYRSAGINLIDFPVYDGEESFVLISPKCWLPNAVNLNFSGWNAIKPCSSDSFVLSDHSDFRELLEVVKKVSPEKVFTYHGFAKDFADFLRVEGFDASALVNKQHSLNNFF
ncbi:MAG: hypothetical protein GON13_03285 [Nanoarchaeota archaeon]|nr:hypothetical protein [Nanoarchaeota archaeon]